MKQGEIRAGSDGTILYTSPQELGNYEPYDTVYIESVDTGEIVAIESRGGDYMDDEGTLYSRTQDGDYIDYFGNHYVDVDW